MKVPRTKGLADFEKLNDELREAEAKSFGTRLPRGMERHREQLVQAIASDRNSRIRIGQIAARYRDHYKIDQTWMPIGESIARSLGYKSYTSLNTLMKAAIGASKIPQPLLAVLIELGIDPTESKFRQLVKELQSTDFSGDDKEARSVAQAAIDRFSARKRDATSNRRKDNSASAAQFGDRIARQVAINVRSLPSGERRAQAEAILRQIEGAIRSATPGWNIRLTWVRSASTIEVAKSGDQESTSSAASLRGELLPIRSSAVGAAMPEVTNVNSAVPVDDRSPEPRRARPNHKLPVRSVDNNQLSLSFEELALISGGRR